MAHKALEMQCVCLHVLLVDAVVAQLGIGEGDNLTRIRRIAHDLLVTHHGRVEHNLAEGLALRSNTSAPEGRAVLKRQEGLPMPAAIDQEVHSNTVLSACSAADVP